MRAPAPRPPAGAPARPRALSHLSGRCRLGSLHRSPCAPRCGEGAVSGGALEGEGSISGPPCRLLLRLRRRRLGSSPLPRISRLPSLPPNITKCLQCSGRGVCVCVRVCHSDPRPPFGSSGYFAVITLAAFRRRQRFFLWAHPVLVILKPGLIVFWQLPDSSVSERLPPATQVARSPLF